MKRKPIDILKPSAIRPLLALVAFFFLTACGDGNDESAKLQKTCDTLFSCGAYTYIEEAEDCSTNINAALELFAEIEGNDSVCKNLGHEYQTMLECIEGLTCNQMFITGISGEQTKLEKCKSRFKEEAGALTEEDIATCFPGCTGEPCYFESKIPEFIMAF